MMPTFGLWTNVRELSRTNDSNETVVVPSADPFHNPRLLHFPPRSGYSIIANVARGLAMNWEIVATFDNAIAAEMATSMLESQGVTTFISAGKSSTSSL